MAVAFCVKISILMGLLFGQGQPARLYTEEDPVVILSSDSLKQFVSNSSSAWLLQFYSSWCGHCIQYSPTWKALAGDVKGRWILILFLFMHSFEEEHSIEAFTSGAHRVFKDSNILTELIWGDHPYWGGGTFYIFRGTVIDNHIELSKNAMVLSRYCH